MEYLSFVQPYKHEKLTLSLMLVQDNLYGRIVTQYLLWIASQLDQAATYVYVCPLNALIRIQCVFTQ